MLLLSTTWGFASPRFVIYIHIVLFTYPFPLKIGYAYKHGYILISQKSYI